MMVVIVILLIVFSLGWVVVDSMRQADKVTEGARLTLSFFEGARDRALHDRLPRGVRLIPDPNNSSYITSMVYIGPAGKMSEGAVSISSTDRRTLTPSDPALWNRLRQRGLIYTGGSRIKIDGNFYTVYYDSTNSVWKLTKDFVGVFNSYRSAYELDLAAAVLPNQEPRQLPAGVIIHRPTSDLPTLDIMFSPRGTIVGQASLHGHLHLMVRSLADVVDGRGIGHQNNESPELIVTVTTQAGSVTTHEADPTDNIDNATGMSGSDGKPDDPFRYAETGKETE